MLRERWNIGFVVSKTKAWAVWWKENALVAPAG
jgi:hypothetical protein